MNTNSPTGRLLARLDGVRLSGSGRWMAKCPAHDDSTASLSVREGDDGRVLMYCFAGCGACDIADAVGLSMHELFDTLPDTGFGTTASDTLRRVAAPIPAKDALKMLHEAALTVYLIAGRLANGEPFDKHYADLRDAAKNISDVRVAWLDAP